MKATFKRYIAKLALLAMVTLSMLSLAPAALTLAATDPCDNTTNAPGSVTAGKVQNNVNQTPIVHDIQMIVDFLSAGVGIIVTGVIIVGGIQYIMAGGNPNAVTAARQRITNGLIALVAFIFALAFLQWLIPGGVFK